jgi:hypothetical protein
LHRAFPLPAAAIGWLNACHTKVNERLARWLSGAALAWLERRCQSL